MINQFDLIIDSREGQLIQSLGSEHLKKECGHVLFETQQLDIGDIIFQYDQQIVCLIERKTLEDYAASITDKRSKNQSIRISQLKKTNPEVIIIYLIEGKQINKDHKFRNGITRDTLYSSIIHRVIRDKFIIYRTNDIDDTALVIAKLYDKLPEELIKQNVNCDERLEYLKTIKLAKKDNMTPENCYLCQLSQIPGVSIETANVIAGQYPSIRSLIMAYEALDNVPSKENLLAELSITLTNDKTRRLGNVISKRVFEFLCPGGNKLKLKLKSENEIKV